MICPMCNNLSIKFHSEVDALDKVIHYSECKQCGFRSSRCDTKDLAMVKLQDMINARLYVDMKLLDGSCNKNLLTELAALKEEYKILRNLIGAAHVSLSSHVDMLDIRDK